MSNWTIMKVSEYSPGLLGRVTELHGRYYHHHWGFDLFFEAKVAMEMVPFLERFVPVRDGLWVSMKHDRVIGSVAICGQDAGTVGARLRWLIVEPEHQGMGIGKALVEKAVDFCRRSGFRRVWLTTFAGLDAARHIYEKEGFQLQEEQEDAHWGRTVREQLFELLM